MPNKNGKAKLSQFKPQTRNANKGNQAGIRELDKSIRRDGYSAPMVAAADGEVFAGSKRLERAADVFGLDVEPLIIRSKGDRPVIHIREDIPNAADPRAVRLGVADNAIASADWNPDGEVLALLAAEDAAIAELVKADDKAAKALLEYASGQGGDADAEPQIDRAEELNKKWKVAAGDLFAIGSHRLLCGDSTRREDVDRVMGGEKAQILFTSPPYWVGFEYEKENKWGQVLDFIETFAGVYPEFVNADGRMIINTGTVQAGELTKGPAYMELLLDTWVAYLKLNGWLLRYVRFWVKDGGLLHTAPRSDCIDQHTEFIGYFYNPKAKFRGQERTAGAGAWAGKGYWDDIPGAARQSGHVAAFPVEFANRNIVLFSVGGEVVLEPFAGSGTTLVACQNLSRRCRAIEISPAYVAVCLERMATAFPDLVIERVKNGKARK